MIKKINNKNAATAGQIQALFQASYQVEAELLGAEDFPPLKRKLANYIDSETDFYGCSKDNKIVAVVEVASCDRNTEIHSLVVHPAYFRQGLGKQLVQFVFEAFDSKTFTVETGLKNEPASKLYKKLGFKEEKQWDTEIGIRKIKFIKTAT